MKKTLLAAAVLGALVGAAPAGAQIFTPTYMSPQVANDVGVYLSDGPGDLAIEGIWRRSLGSYDLGLRAGYADLGDGALLLGIEARNPIVLAGAPIGLAFTASAQGALGDASGIGGAVGFTAGHTFRTPTVAVTPYVHPRFALMVFPDRAGDDDTDTDLLADLGFNFDFPSNMSLRVGVALDDRNADWGIGFAWRP